MKGYTKVTPTSTPPSAGLRSAPSVLIVSGFQLGGVGSNFFSVILLKRDCVVSSVHGLGDVSCPHVDLGAGHGGKREVLSASFIERLARVLFKDQFEEHSRAEPEQSQRERERESTTSLHRRSTAALTDGTPNRRPPCHRRCLSWRAPSSKSAPLHAKSSAAAGSLNSSVAGVGILPGELPGKRRVSRYDIVVHGQFHGGLVGLNEVGGVRDEQERRLLRPAAAEHAHLADRLPEDRRLERAGAD